MRKALIVSGALALVAPSLSAQTARSQTQTQRWNDRPTTTWSDEAPRVKVFIEGPREMGWGTPMRVRFEVSDNAYVAVVHVGSDGRMTILFPYSRTQRAAVRAGQVNYVRNPRLGGQSAFISSGSMGGYVFAIASFQPLDFSMFENRDYDRIGGYSRFTVANRSIARRPDVFIDRFAAAVLWDKDTPYDYDVDYYYGSGFGGATAMNAYSLCGSMFRTFGYSGYAYPSVGFMYSYHAAYHDWYDWDIAGYPYRAMCNSYLLGVRCFSFIAVYTSLYNCGYNQTAWNPQNPPVVGQPADSTVPNEGVVRGGLFGPTPTPIPVTAGGDAPPLERPSANGPPIGSFDQVRRAGPTDLDGALSIPTRATRKMKEDDTRRDREATGSAPARAGSTGFDRAETADKSPKTTAGAEPVTRPSAPPSREPTKAKGTSEPRRETGTRRGDFAGTTSRPSDPGRDRVSRPASTGSTGGSTGSGTSQPASIQGTSTTDKKKPPQ